MSGQGASSVARMSIWSTAGSLDAVRAVADRLAAEWLASGVYRPGRVEAARVTEGRLCLSIVAAPIGGPALDRVGIAAALVAAADAALRDVGCDVGSVDRARENAVDTAGYEAGVAEGASAISGSEAS